MLSYFAVPSAPDILESIAHYSQMSDKITGLTTKFNEVVNTKIFLSNSTVIIIILLSYNSGAIQCITIH